jgi:hypothetical protein
MSAKLPPTRQWTDKKCRFSVEGRVTILVRASGVSKTPRSSTGGVLEDDFSAENRGYHLNPTMAVWPKVQPPWRPSNRTGLATLCVEPSLGLRSPTALKVGYHLRLAPALGFCSQNQEVRMRRLLPVPAVIVLAASLLAQTSPPPGPDARPAPGTYRVLARYGGSAGSGALKSEPQVVTLSERDHKTMQLTMVKSGAE